MTALSWWVPSLPPTSNQIYIRHPQGKGRILSSQARAFKIKAMQALQEGGKLATVSLPQNVPYELKLAIFFEHVENKNSKQGNRFKKMDTSNRIKLIEDTVAEAVGLDDSHNFRVVVEKHCDPSNPGIWVHLRQIDETEVGLTKEAYEIRLRESEQLGVGSTSPARRLFGRCTHRDTKGGPDSNP